MKVPVRTTQEVFSEGPDTPLQDQKLSGDMVGQVGRALQRGGADIAHGEEALQQWKTRQNETAVNDAYSNQFSPKFRELYQKYYDLQGKDAVDARPEFTNKMEQLRNETRQQLPNQQQQLMFDHVSRRRVEMELDGMARYSDQQNKVWQHETYTSTMKNLRTQAADKWNDEAAFGNALGSGLAEIDRFAALSGKSAEWVRSEAQKHMSDAAVDRLSSWMLKDPIGAQQWYQANTSMIEGQQRPILEHHLKASVQPVEAKTVAERIISGSVLNPEKQGDVLIPVAATQESMAKDQPAPLTMRDTRAQLATWVSTAEQAAERLHPGDPVFRDLVVTQVKGYVNTIVAAQDGIARQAHGALMAAALGSQGGAKPLTLDDLLTSSDAKRAWALTDPQGQRGILALLEHNAKDARGEFTRSNPRVVNDLFNRVHLPEGDPNQIKSAAQLAPYFSQGLNKSDYDWLRKEIDENQKPEGNMFLRDVRDVEQTAHRALMGKANMIMQPDVGEDAARRFRVDLRQKIEQYRAAGKDPRLLLTPGTPDYVASPERLSTFMAKPQNAVADEAERRRRAEAPGKAEPAKPALPRAVNAKTGETLELRDGKWQKLQ